MTQTVFILDRCAEPNPGRVFVSFIAGDPVYAMRLPIDAWRDMGKPKTITVTVQPGDLLNVDDAVAA